MTAVTVSMRLLIPGLALVLLFVPVFAAEPVTGTFSDPAADFHLKGVLVSTSGRSALVNNRVAREGDRVAGAEILSIREGEVRIFMGSQELTVRVGSTAARAKSSGSSTVRPTDSDSHYGPVMRGETLSEIAERHLVDDVSLNQVMIALFEANPRAFDDNINRLHEGAILRIPAGNIVRRQATVTAEAEVMRQMAAWRSDRQQPVHVADVVDPLTYGPVAAGETLSGIAVNFLRDGATINQTMTALFDANPQAFSGNINVLLEGAVLRIPDAVALHHQTPEMATAEVVRQTNAWRHEADPPLQSASANDAVKPAALDPDPPADHIILSMNSRE